MSDTLIKVEGVSKKFCRSLKRSLWYGMQDLGNELVGRKRGGGDGLRPDEFWAVNDVSFEIKRGECLGLIGRNGAGKTTLLRMLIGLIKPDTGRIEMKGRICALISLGAGFNPILTGRENIYVNASVLGLSKREIENKVEGIIDFAEIGDFIDMPVQSYSSGMSVRLGFAIASALDPDVLLLDEVLAVGDGAFKFKCYRRIDDLLKKSAVIFVTHDMPQLSRICNRTLVLRLGREFFQGATFQGVQAYQAVNSDGGGVPERVLKVYKPILAFTVIDLPREVEYQSRLIFRIELSAEEKIGAVALRFDLKNQGGAFAASCLVQSENFDVFVVAGINSWEIVISSLPLKPGNYLVDMNLSDQFGALIAVWSGFHSIEVTGGCIGIVPDCQLTLSAWNDISHRGVESRA